MTSTIRETNKEMLSDDMEHESESSIDKVSTSEFGEDPKELDPGSKTHRNT